MCVKQQRISQGIVLRMIVALGLKGSGFDSEEMDWVENEVRNKM